MKFRFKKYWLFIASVVIALPALAMFFTWPAELLQVPLIRQDQAQSTDVIVVLGAGARAHGEPLPPQGKERVMLGLDLVDQGYASTVIMSGGLSKQSGFVESDLMKTYAVSLGGTADDVIVENRSTSTWENAMYVQEIMQRNKWDDALVVTSPYHTFRSCAIFHKLGMTVKCISAPLNLIPTDTFYERLTDLRSVVREYGAIVYYFFRGYI